MQERAAFKHNRFHAMTQRVWTLYVFNHAYLHTDFPNVFPFGSLYLGSNINHTLHTKHDAHPCGWNRWGFMLRAVYGCRLALCEHIRCQTSKEETLKRGSSQNNVVRPRDGGPGYFIDWSYSIPIICVTRFPVILIYFPYVPYWLHVQWPTLGQRQREIWRNRRG